MQKSQENKKEKDNLTNNIISQGNVTISVQKGDQILRVVSSHNSGSLSLFKFLALCLSGDYKTADGLRPFKLKLFKIIPKTGAQFDPTQPDTNPDYASTSFISLAEAPIVQTHAKDKTATVTIHFIVPYSYIHEGYNQLCLYPVRTQSNEDYSAFYFLLDEEGQLRTEKVEANSNYNLVVDWELKISGKEDWE